MAEALSKSEIDALLALAANDPNKKGNPAGKSSGVDAEPQYTSGKRKTIRKMDFARPSKFNKDQLRTLQMLHESFARRASNYLSGTVRTLVEIHVQKTEQAPYGDFIQRLPVPTFSAVVDIPSLGTNGIIAIDLPLVFAMIDRMLGGPGSKDPNVRELTEIEEGLAANLVERLLEELSGSWSELVPVDFALRSIEMNAHFAQIVPESDACVLVDLEIDAGGANGIFSICLPYRSIETVVGSLAAHRYFSSGESKPKQTNQMVTNIKNIMMPVRAEIGEIKLPVSDVLNIENGDVISLGRRVDDGMQLKVGNTHTYRAMPGRDGNHMAVRIIERIGDDA